MFAKLLSLFALAALLGALQTESFVVLATVNPANPVKLLPVVQSPIPSARLQQYPQQQQQPQAESEDVPKTDAMNSTNRKNFGDKEKSAPAGPTKEAITPVAPPSSALKKQPNGKAGKKENLKMENGQQMQAGASVKEEEGVYYIYHPNGLLQRVVYSTESQDMGYTAQLIYKDVEPIKDPIYTYDEQTLQFSRITL